MSTPWPTELKVRASGAVLQASFDDGAAYDLPAPLLRKMTPSADGRGHGADTFRPLAIAADEVTIRDVRAVGRYAVKIVFSDGHDTGLYTWDRLHRIGRERALLES